MAAGDKTKKKWKKNQLPFKEEKCAVLENHPRNTLTSLLVFCILWRLQASTENGSMVIFCSSAQLYKKTPKLAWERERSVMHNGTLLSFPKVCLCCHVFRGHQRCALNIPTVCSQQTHTASTHSRQRPRECATLLKMGKDRLGRSSLPNPGFSVLIKACWTRERLDSIWQCYPLYKQKCEEVNYIV